MFVRLKKKNRKTTALKDVVGWAKLFIYFFKQISYSRKSWAKYKSWQKLFRKVLIFVWRWCCSILVVISSGQHYSLFFLMKCLKFKLNLQWGLITYRVLFIRFNSLLYLYKCVFHS